MGSCFSSAPAQQSHATQNPASYAAAVASTAVHAVSDFIHDQAPSATVNPNQTDPPGLQVISNAYVFKMPDGDTFTCDYTDEAGQKVTARVRIMGIDCPESNQNFGQEARQIGESLILRTRVTLHLHTTDRYGRLVADVITENRLNYGEQLLRQGAAWHYKAYDKRTCLAQLESEAREAKVGLWSYPRPQEPWEYRRRRREAAN